MTIEETFLGTLAGGAISGLIGFLTTRYDRKLVRREAHMREHRDNFRMIQQALVGLRSAIWRVTAKGSEDLRLPKWDRPPAIALLRTYSVSDFQSAEPIGDNRFSISSVDRVLYLDIEKHFEQLSAQLAELENMVRTAGVRLDEIAYELTTTVYTQMSSSDLQVLKWSLDKGQKVRLREVVDTQEGSWYAGAIFLMLIKEDTGNWPNEYAQLERYGLAAGLQKLTDEIELIDGKKVNEMLRLRKRLFDQIDTCGNLIDQFAHKTTIEHKCEYL